jgi:hypothetical protein
MKPYWSAILDFYLEGFRSMCLGRVLWAIILLKLFLMFAVLKPFFFPDYLKTNFATEGERADHVLARLAAPGEVDIFAPSASPAKSGATRPRAGGKHPPASGTTQTRR